MPSPSNSPGRSISQSKVRTKRSSVSKAYGLKENQIQSAGTIVDPSATAAQILALPPGYNPTAPLTKSPSNPVEFGAPEAAAPQGSASLPRPISNTNVVTSAAISRPENVRLEPSTAALAPSEPPTTRQVAVKQRGLLDLTYRAGAIVELVFSLLATLSFLGLWIFMLTASCYEDMVWIFITRAVAVCSFVMSLFVAFHSCFERRVFFNKGVLGCIFFFILAVIIFSNMIAAFYAMNCICQCSQTSNAFKASTSHDLIIFILEMVGSSGLVAVLLVSASVHN